jgi:hypothetical protein
MTAQVNILANLEIRGAQNLPVENVVEDLITKLEGLTSEIQANCDNIPAVTQLMKTVRELQFSCSSLIDRNTPDEWHKPAIEWNSNLALLKIQPSLTTNAFEDDIIFKVKKIYEESIGHSDFARALCLARLFLPSYHLSHPPLSRVPSAYLRSYLSFLLEDMAVLYPGDSEKYIRHMEKVGESILEFLTSLYTLPQDRVTVFQHLIQKSDYAVYILYAWGNLRRIMELRFQLIQQICAAFNLNVDWTPPPRQKGQKIRIGIISKTIYSGGETWGMLANIAALDRNRYEIVLIIADKHWNGYHHDINYYRRLVESVDEIVSNDSELVIDQVPWFRNLNLDILWHQTTVGLHGINSNAYLFAHKLARIGCTTFGTYAGTSGNPNFQYCFCIAPVFPSQNWNEELTEKPLEISAPSIDIPVENWVNRFGEFQSADHKTVTRESLRIPSDAVVYFGGATLAKYSPELMMTWLKIIKNVPNSYLVLYPFNPAWYASRETLMGFHAKLQAALMLTGVDSERIKLVKDVGSNDIINMHRWGHIYLGSFPYGGVTSLTEALRSNLCPVCWSGQYLRENGDANILSNHELHDLLARNIEEYIERGTRFGLDASFRASVKARIQDAWVTKRPAFASRIAKETAAFIDKIVEEDLGDTA